MKKPGIFWTACALFLLTVLVFCLAYEGYQLYFASCEQGCPVSFAPLYRLALGFSPFIILSAILAGICKKREAGGGAKPGQKK